MRNMFSVAISAALALSLLAAPDYSAYAQSRSRGTTSTGGSSSQTRSTSSGSSTQTRSSSSSSQSRSSSSATQTRSSSSSSQTRSSSATSQTRNNSTATQTRSTGTSSQTRSTGSSSSATRSSGTTTSSQTRNGGSSSASQTRSSGSSSATRSSGSSSSATRSSGSTSGSSATRSNGSSSSSTRTSGTASQSGSTPTRSNGSTATPSRSNSSSASSSSSTSGQTTQPAQTTPVRTTPTRQNSNVTKSGLGTVNTNPEAQRAGQSSSGSNATATPNRRGGRQDDLHIAPNRYQVQNNDVMRIPPGERGYCPYDRPGKFWGPNPHYFGYHVEVLPPRPHHFVHWGVDYYMHNDIYYRRHGAHYIVCRPPFGVVLSHTLRDLHLASVRFAYYTNVYRTYGLVNDNWRTIDQQNRIIAQNNAIIAAQNRSIAMNITAAGQSYSIANTLGLVQSYAYADKEYYYEDGVFYIINNSGYYQVIVPPAGALVDSLPDDYDIISFGGVEYYKVDDTVYRLVLIQGTPLLEVLGQSYR